MRLSAAELLADVDPGAAAPACLAIARDQTVGDEVRRSAAERLAGLATLLGRKQHLTGLSRTDWTVPDYGV